MDQALGKPQKKVSYLNGRWNVGTFEKKVPKSLFSLMARPFTPS